MAQLEDGHAPVLAGGTAAVRPGDVGGKSGWRSAVMFADQEEQIRWLRAMVDRYKGNALVHDKAISIVFPTCPPKNKLCHAVAIARWVQKNVVYVNEGAETFQSPVRTLSYRFGDCDDFATTICAMCESLGVPTQLVGLRWAGAGGGPAIYRHIYARAIIDGRRVPLDATLSTDVGLFTDPMAISLKRGDNPSVFAL